LSAGLTTEPNINEPDDFYRELLATHDSLSEQEQNKLNARLVLILANHVGDRSILREAMELALRDAVISNAD